MAPAPHNLRDQHDAATLAQSASIQRTLEDAYTPIAASLRAQLADLLAPPTTPDQIAHSAQLSKLLDAIDAQIAAFSASATSTIAQAQQDAATLATDHAQALITSGVDAPAGALTLNGPRQAAIEALIGRAYDGSPLSDLLAKLGPETAATVKAALLTGLANGDGPRQIAATFDQAIDGGRARALLIARTEILNAYRSAALENYRANSDVVDNWEWSADSAACPECAVKDGQEYPLSAPFDTHPGCRCVPVPITKSWADLGIAMADFSIAEPAGITIGA